MKRTDSPEFYDYPEEDCGLTVEDWGVPDWRDEAAYNRLSALTPPQWAWEFVRRNPDYRLGWVFEFGPHLARGGSPEDLPRVSQIWREYGLRAPLDPTKGADDPPFEDGRPRICAGPDKLDLTIGPSETAVIFDRGLPIDEQLAETKRYLSARAQYATSLVPRRRLRRAEYPVYVRVLDASACGATIREIASTVCSDIAGEEPEIARDRVRKHLRAAKFLRARGYRLIATMRSPKRQSSPRGK